MMNKFLITALVATGLGMGFAPVANSQTSDTAEVEFTGTLEDVCEVFDVVNGTLGFTADQRTVSTYDGGFPGELAFSDGCTSVFIEASSSNPNLDVFGSLQFPQFNNFEIFSSGFPESIVFGGDNEGYALVNAAGSNLDQTPLTPGEYFITVTITLTAN